MNLSPTAQATLLLTSYFSKAGSEQAKPLTNGEWGRFALWLKEKAIAPAALLAPDPKPLLNGWHDVRISDERIVQLLSRGHSLALAVEKWQRAGLWIVTRSDPEYPARLKQRLKNDSPPVLFGCGQQNLLAVESLAVVGSRHASETDLCFTRQLGEKAAQEGIAIVSGGARGIDEAAMLGCLNHGGYVIGVMADSLLKEVTHSRWRQGLLDGRAVLVSPFYPEAGFSAGNAMARNKYIYCLANSALVVHSGQQGGTRNGAEENLRKQWVPLWVKPTEDQSAANAELVAQGGRWCAVDINNIQLPELIAADTHMPAPRKEPVDLFTTGTQPSQPELFTSDASEAVTLAIDLPPISKETTASPIETAAAGSGVDFYYYFVGTMRTIAATPVTVDEIAAQTRLHKTQISDWLKRAIDEDKAKKLSRPVRYQWIER